MTTTKLLSISCLLIVAAGCASLPDDWSLPDLPDIPGLPETPPTEESDGVVLTDLIQDPNNNLIDANLKPIIVWFSHDGKEVWQRQDGYYAGRVGDRKAYNIESKFRERWTGIQEYYLHLSGDESILKSNGNLVAVFTEVLSWRDFNPNRKGYIKATGEYHAAPDDVRYTFVLDTGHKMVFLVRNGRDHFGEAGSGGFQFLDPQGRNRASWNINNQTSHTGKKVSLRH